MCVYFTKEISFKATDVTQILWFHVRRYVFQDNLDEKHLGYPSRIYSPSDCLISFLIDSAKEAGEPQI